LFNFMNASGLNFMRAFDIACLLHRASFLPNNWEY
jgi:hypothetical protein